MGHLDHHQNPLYLHDHYLGGTLHILSSTAPQYSPIPQDPLYQHLFALPHASLHLTYEKQALTVACEGNSFRVRQIIRDKKTNSFSFYQNLLHVCRDNNLNVLLGNGMALYSLTCYVHALLRKQQIKLMILSFFLALFVTLLSQCNDELHAPLSSMAACMLSAAVRLLQGTLHSGA